MWREGSDRYINMTSGQSLPQPSDTLRPYYFFRKSFPFFQAIFKLSEINFNNNKQKGIDHSTQPGRKVSEDQKGVYQNFQNCGRQTDRNIYVGSCFLVNK